MIIARHNLIGLKDVCRGQRERESRQMYIETSKKHVHKQPKDNDG